MHPLIPSQRQERAAARTRASIQTHPLISFQRQERATVPAVKQQLLTVPAHSRRPKNLICNRRRIGIPIRPGARQCNLEPSGMLHQRSRHTHGRSSIPYASLCNKEEAEKLATELIGNQQPVRASKEQTERMKGFIAEVIRRYGPFARQNKDAS